MTNAPPPDELEMAEAVTHARLAALGMLVAGLAHEINTPLGTLNSNHDVLRRALVRLQAILADEVVEPHELDEVRRVIAAVDSILHVNDLAVERMVSLVGSLRNFGRLDCADLDVVDLHEGIDSTLAILAHELRPLTVVRDYGDVPRVECHAQQVNQVFMNLLLNAGQATLPGGTITVSTWAAQDRVHVRVTDTGTGILPAVLPRIFEPGFTTKSGRVGMGMGLLISHQIIDHHAGAITVKSEPGAGSSFTVSLPVAYRGTAGR
jgi:two-component system, NtrC family, sensor kinase